MASAFWVFGEYGFQWQRMSPLGTQPNREGDAFSGQSQGIVVEVGVALRRLWAGMAEQFAHDEQRLPGRGKQAGEGMAQVVNTNFLQACDGASLRPSAAYFDQRRAEASGKYERPYGLGAAPFEQQGNGSRELNPP